MSDIPPEITSVLNTTIAQSAILTEVTDELTNRLQQWGVESHDELTWIAILTEEVEQARMADTTPNTLGFIDIDLYRQELIHVAAAAVAAIEALDRSTEGEPAR